MRLHGLLVVTTSWSRFGAPKGLFPAEEVRHGIHGGAVETSIMLARYGQHVRSDAIADFRSAAIAMEDRYRQLSAHRPAPFAWQAQDLHASGAVGDATLASAEKGEQLIEHGARAFCELLEDVDKFDLTTLAPGPALVTLAGQRQHGGRSPDPPGRGRAQPAGPTSPSGPLPWSLWHPRHR